MTIKTNSKADLKKMIDFLIEGYQQHESMDLYKVAKALEELADFYREVSDLVDFARSQQDGDDIIGHRD